MSQNYKLLYDDMLSNDPTRSHTDDAAAERETSYPTAGNVRNVNFVLLNGDMEFFNYAYLVSGKYQSVNNCILLSFTSHQVKLAGVYMIALYYDFFYHRPRNVICVDARYNATAKKNEPIVNDIIIKENGKG